MLARESVFECGRFWRHLATFCHWPLHLCLPHFASFHFGFGFTSEHSSTKTSSWRADVRLGLPGGRPLVSHVTHCSAPLARTSDAVLTGLSGTQLSASGASTLSVVRTAAGGDCWCPWGGWTGCAGCVVAAGQCGTTAACTGLSMPRHPPSSVARGGHTLQVRTGSTVTATRPTVGGATLQSWTSMTDANHSLTSPRPRATTCQHRGA